MTSPDRSEQSPTTVPKAPSFRKRELVGVLCLGLAIAAILGADALDGDVFVSTEVVHRYTQPWSQGFEATTPPHNDYLSDQGTYFHPWNVYIREELRAGRAPIWTGESFGGVPFFGNYSSALLSPFTWIYVLWPSVDQAFLVVAMVKWLLALLGTYAWVRCLGVGRAASLAAGIAYGFCGYQVVWINAALTNVSPLAPWCLLAIERLVRRPGPGAFAVLALLWFFQLMGGHPETSLYLGLATAAYGVLRAWTAPHAGRRAVPWLIAAGVAACGLSVVQTWPFLEYSLDSEAIHLRGARIDEAPLSPFSLLGLPLLAALVAVAAWARRSARVRKFAALSAACVLLGAGCRTLGMQPTALLLLLPDFYGNPLDGNHYLGPFTYTDVSGGFCAGIVVVLAWLTVVHRWREPLVRVLTVLVVLLLARFFRLPLLTQILDAIPAVKETVTMRTLGMVALFLALLAAMGTEHLVRRPQSLTLPLITLLFFCVGLAAPVERLRAETAPVSVASASDTTFQNLPMRLEAKGDTEIPVETTLEGRAPAEVERLLVRVGDFGLGEVTRPEDAPPGPWPFQVHWVGTSRLPEGRYVVSIDALQADGSTRALAESFVDVLRSPSFTWRWLLLPLSLGMVLAACRRPRWLRLAVPLAITVELVGFAQPYGDVTPRDQLPTRPIPPIDWLQERMQAEGPFRILGARTALQPSLHYLFGLHALRGYDSIEPHTYTSVLRYLFEDGRERLWVEQDFSTMQLDSALADVFNLRYVLSEEEPDPGWVERTRVGTLRVYENPDAKARAFTVQRAWSVAAHGDFPPQEQVADMAVWEEGEDVTLPGAGVVQDLDYANGHIRVVVDSPSGTILVVSENLFPGWEAQVDGQEAVLRRSHGTFMSLELPAGSHQVELRYRPASVYTGAWISLATLVLVLAMLLVPRLTHGGGKTSKPSRPGH